MPIVGRGDGPFCSSSSLFTLDEFEIGHPGPRHNGAVASCHRPLPILHARHARPGPRRTRLESSSVVRTTACVFSALGAADTD